MSYSIKRKLNLNLCLKLDHILPGQKMSNGFRFFGGSWHIHPEIGPFGEEQSAPKRSHSGNVTCHTSASAVCISSCLTLWLCASAAAMPCNWHQLERWGPGTVQTRHINRLCLYTSHKWIGNMMSCPLGRNERVFNCAGLFKIQILKQHMASCSQQHIHQRAVESVYCIGSTAFAMRNFKVTVHNKKYRLKKKISHLKLHTGTEAKCREHTHSSCIPFDGLHLCVCVGGGGIFQ